MFLKPFPKASTPLPASVCRISCLPVLFFLLIFLPGCFSKTAALSKESTLSFSYKRIGFSLTMPKGWVMTPEPGILFSSEFRRKGIPLVRLSLLSEEDIPFLVHYLRITKNEPFAKQMLGFSQGQLSQITLHSSSHYRLEDKTWIEIIWSGEREGIPKMFHSFLIPTDNAIVQLHFEFSAQLYKSPDGMIKPVLQGIALNAVPEASPEKIALTYRSVGSIYNRQGRFQEAINFFKLALQKQPDDIELHLLLANTFFKKKAYKAALSTFLKASEMDAQNAKAYEGLGKTYFKMDRFEKGISASKYALSLTNQEAPLYLLIGNAYLKQNKIEKAIRSFQSLLKRKQLETEAHLGIGKAYLKMALYEQAIIEFEEVLARQPDHKAPHCLLEKAFFEIGATEKSKAAKMLCKKERP